jgi:pimeloyl-ACP methyl ester carboxylesterase
MLWEIMLEVLVELLSASGEIFKSFFGLLKEIFKGKKDATAEDKKRRGEQLLIASIIGLVIAVAFMFPGVRKFVFHGGTQRMIARHGPPITEQPRNPLPMAQYTSPQLFSKRRAMMVDDDGLKRYVYYYWYAPPAPPPGQKLPIVVVLHDASGMDFGAIYLRMGTVQKYFPAYLLIPQSPLGNIWDSPVAWSGDEGIKVDPAQVPIEEARSIRDVGPLLAAATELGAVDESRMYIIGCDIGADGVYGALSRYPGLFAGGVAIGGKWSFADRTKLAKTPLLILQGSGDQVVPSSHSSMLAQIIGTAGGEAAYHEFPKLGHECDPPAYYSMAVWKWLFSQTRAAPRPAPPPPPPQALAPAAPVGAAVP